MRRLETLNINKATQPDGIGQVCPVGHSIMRKHILENGSNLLIQDFATNFYYTEAKREIVKAGGETTEVARFEITALNWRAF